MYKSEEKGKDFACMHCFRKHEGSKKWDHVWLIPQ
jgi:hypothetical protein